jgi:hypothetical protein
MYYKDKQKEKGKSKMKKINVYLTNGYCDVKFNIGMEQTLITLKTPESTVYQYLKLEEFDFDVDNYSATIVEIMADFFSDDFVLTDVA